MKTLTMPAATGTQNGNFDGISILNRILSDRTMGVEIHHTSNYDIFRRPRGAPAADQ